MRHRGRLARNVPRAVTHRPALRRVLFVRGLLQWQAADGRQQLEFLLFADELGLITQPVRQKQTRAEQILLHCELQWVWMHATSDRMAAHRFYGGRRALAPGLRWLALSRVDAGEAKKVAFDFLARAQMCGQVRFGSLRCSWPTLIRFAET